jgi:hypothetical protein
LAQQEKLYSEVNVAEFLYHEPCDNCGSKDNRAVYDDGSKWCFGCFTYTPGNATHRLFSSERTKKILERPKDLTKELPVVAKNWLLKYGLTNFNEWRWSPMQKLLVWSNSEDFAIGRNLGNPQLPKYMMYGGKKPVLLFGNTEKNSPVFLVEDLVSAMVISRNGGTAIPLFGVHVRKDIIDFLKRHEYNKVAVWLDRDKAQEALRQVNMLKQYFNNVSLVVTERDPKESKVPR